MHTEVADISLLAKARRDCALALQLMRINYMFGYIVYALLLLAFVAAVGGLISESAKHADKIAHIVGVFQQAGAGLRDLVAQDPRTLLLLVLLALPFLCKKTVDGNPVACMLLASYFLVAAGHGFYTLAVDLIYGFPRVDLAGAIGSKTYQSIAGEDIDRDVRLLPLRLFSLFISVVYWSLIWNVVRIHVLPAYRSVRPFKQFVFAPATDFRSVFFTPLRSFAHLFRRDFLALRPLGVLTAYALFLALQWLAMTWPFYAATPQFQGAVVKSVAATSIEDTRIIQFYLGEVYLIALVMLLIRLVSWLSKLSLHAARRLAATTAGRLLAADERPPVLYLRSFRNDVLPAREVNEGLGFYDPTRERSRLEELVAARCSVVGPVVAIADPKTPIQPTGASREHAADADWQDVVRHLMSEAALIVVVMDLTENLRWEIETLRRSELLDRAVFLFPPAVELERSGRRWWVTPTAVGFLAVLMSASLFDAAGALAAGALAIAIGIVMRRRVHRQRAAHAARFEALRLESPGAGGAAYARSVLGILQQHRIVDEQGIVSAIERVDEIRLVTVRNGAVQVQTSRTGMHSDYDVALRVALAEMERGRPITMRARVASAWFFLRLAGAAAALAALGVGLATVPGSFYQGESASLHLLLELDANAVRNDMGVALLGDVRRVVQEDRLDAVTRLAPTGNAVEATMRGGEGGQQLLARLKELGTWPPGALEIEDAGSLIRVTVTTAAIAERVRQSADRSVQILQKRMEGLGLRPKVGRDGVDRILVQVPREHDIARLKGLILLQAKLSFRSIDTSMSADEARQGRVPRSSEILYDRDRVPHLVSRQVLISGDDLVDALPAWDRDQAVVLFRFNANGTRRLAQVTRDNIGRAVAVVLDKTVLSAPAIREPILAGSVQISGAFTVEQANDLALQVRAGALPAPLSIIEERTVEPVTKLNSMAK
jgi:protein-export membrane protein SecD